MAYQPTPAHIAQAQAMMGVWETKSTAVGADFGAKQMARMSDAALKTEDDAHWKANAWGPNNTDGHMN